MRQSGKLSILIFMTIFPALGTIYGQEMFRGIVVDSASMAALPSVNIQVKNATAGTTTDENGSFSLRALATDTLVFSLVGYQRLELPLAGYEAGVIRLSEKYTMLKAVTIDEYRRENLYEGMFEDQNARLKRSIPFYLSKAKKEKIRLQGLKEENLRVQTYVEVVVNDPDFKSSFKMKYGLNEDEYYRILTAFNETHYRVMYYLTRAELLSLLSTFFENQALQR